MTTINHPHSLTANTESGLARAGARRILVLILLLAFALRLYRLGLQSIWWDEGHSITVARHSLAAIPTLPIMDVHPPLYFYLLHFWMDWARGSEFALRFLSLLFGLLTVAILYRLGEEMADPAVGLLAASIGALSPMSIAYSQEVRMYAMVTCFCLLSNYAFYRLLKDERRISSWLGYVFFTALSLYTHYFVLFILVFQNVFWFAVTALRAWRLRRRPSKPLNRRLEVGNWRLGKWVAGQLGVALLLTPHLWTAARQVTAYKNVNLSPPALKTFALQCWQAFTVGLTIDASRAAPFTIGIAVILLAGISLHFLTSPSTNAAANSPPPSHRGGQRGGLPLLMAWFVLPLLVYYVVLQERASFAPRYMMIVTPALFLLQAYALWSMGRAAVWLGGLGGLFVLLAFTVALWSYYFDVNHFKDDTRGLARFLEAQVTKDDIVFIDVPHPLDYYYHGAAPMSYLFVDIHTVADVLTKACQGRERLFFVRWRQSDTDPRGAVLFLLDKYGTYLGQQDFRGYDLVWYRLPEEASFSLTPAFEPVQINFEGKVSLVGRAFGGRGQRETSTEAEVARLVVPAGRTMWAALQWQVSPKIDGDYKAALYLRDGRGGLVGQADKDLLNDRHLHTSAWSPDEVVINVYNLTVAPGTPPGKYLLEASLYTPATLERLDVLDARGGARGTAAFLGTMEVVRPDVPPPVEALRIGHPLSIPVAREIQLLGYDRGEEAVQPGETLPLTLYWQALTDVQTDYLLRLYLREEEGRIQDEEVSRPVAGSYPTTLWSEGEIVRDRHDWTIAADIPPGLYQLLLDIIDPTMRATTREIDLGHLTIKGRQRVFEVPSDIQHQRRTNLAGRVEFLGYDLEREGVAPGDVLRLTLYWRALAGMETSYKVFTHLLDGESKIWGQKDDVPGRGTLPTTGWVKGEVIADEYEITVDPEAPAGEYILEIGMYDESTGERLPVLNEREEIQDDRILLGTVRVE